MRDVLSLTIHLLVTFAKLLRPGGAPAVAAESPLLKHQLLIRIYDYVDADIPTLQRMFTKRMRGYRAMGYSIADDIAESITSNLPIRLEPRNTEVESSFGDAAIASAIRTQSDGSQ